jgi:hypothetical protein
MSFGLRWGKAWYERSLDRLCGVWGLDRGSGEWNGHEQYRRDVRRSALSRWSWASPAVEVAAAPIERLVAWRWRA